MKRRWRLWISLGGLALLAAFHAPILRQVAAWLIVNDSFEHCDTLFIVNGDRCYTVAAELFQQKKTDRIALLETPRRPLIEFQIIVPTHEIIRREIIRQGVPPDSILVASGESRHLWDMADRLKDRLTQQPQEQIAVLLDQFSTKRLHFALAHTLTSQQLTQVRIVALADRRYEVSKWWRSRLAMKDVVGAYLTLTHAAVVGHPPPSPARHWERGEFEQRLLMGVEAP